MKQVEPIESRWNRLHGLRQAHLDRCRLCSKLTVPHLLPPENTTINDQLPTPYQSLGADAVNSLASKLWLTLLPPNSRFFRLTLDTAVEQDLEALNNGQAVRSQIEKVLARIEDEILKWIESAKLRSPAFKAIQHLITVGNVLCYIPDAVDYHGWSQEGNGLKVFRLDQYVVVRDPMGNLLELIVREEVSPEALPEEVVAKLDGSKDYRPEDRLPLFTRVYRDGDVFRVHQAIKNTEIPETEGQYKLNSLPWLPLRWSHDGDYGRGRVEEYLGDFLSLEALSQAIVEGSAAAARLLFLVNPNGITRVRDLRKARNGDFVPGLPQDIAPLQLQKSADFRVAQMEIEKLEARIKRAFLMHEAIQRDAERVTALEIKYMAQALEDALGGVYSLLSQELQFPLVKLVMDRLIAAGVIPDLPKEALKPVITTGLDALGRTHEQNKLNAFLETCAAYLGPTFIEYVEPSELIRRVATNVGVDTEGLIRSPEEVAQMRQQQMVAALVQQAGPGVAQEVTKGVVNASQQENE